MYQHCQVCSKPQEPGVLAEARLLAQTMQWRWRFVLCQVGGTRRTAQGVQPEGVMACKFNWGTLLCPGKYLVNYPKVEQQEASKAYPYFSAQLSVAVRDGIVALLL